MHAARGVSRQEIVRVDPIKGRPTNAIVILRRWQHLDLVGDFVNAADALRRHCSRCFDASLVAIADERDDPASTPNAM
jgi:hypothetical protein